MDLQNLNKDRAKSKRRTIDLSAMVYGKVPPQSKDLEEAVLGAIMLEKGAFDIVAEILKAECFYIDAHQRVFAAMQALQQRNSPIDSLTLIEELKTREELETVGGPYFLIRLTNSVVSSANLETHSRIVLQKFMSRELIRIGGIAINEAYEDANDVFDSINTVEIEMSALTVAISR
jgi:replicative DNA helicase